MRPIVVTPGARKSARLVAVTGLFALALCSIPASRAQDATSRAQNSASPPQTATAPAQAMSYGEALRACKKQARIHFKNVARSEGRRYNGRTDYQVVDPCMTAKGFKPPPY